MGSGQCSVVADSLNLYRSSHVSSSAHRDATSNNLHFKVIKKLKHHPAWSWEAGSRQGSQSGGQEFDTEGKMFVEAR